jgi:hypothetical protein
MGRKALAPVEPVQDAALDVDTLNATQNLGAIAQGLQDERDLVNQLLGQAQMAGAFEEFSRTVRTSKLAFVKENKLYRALAGRKNPNGSDFSGTWEEFCQTLGMSSDKADMDIANLRAFGEEALDSMSKMGIGYRELRQWRRLPDDARSALIEAAKTDNKEAVIFLAEELIATHSQEKDSLTKALSDTKADYDAQGSVLANKSAELDKTKQELAKARRQVETLTTDERAKELRVEVAALAFEAEADITGKLREGFIKLAEHAEANGVDHRPFQAAMIQQLEALLGSLRSEFQLPDSSGGEDFSWMNEPTNTQLPAQDA